MMKCYETTNYGITNNLVRKWRFIFAIVLLRCSRWKGGYTNILVSAAGDEKFVSAAGNEKAFFDVEQFTPDVSHRQNVCDRYDDFHTGKVEFKDLLKGIKLNVLMASYDDSFFKYDEENGINPDYPGLTAVIMDELARRAGFTWRDSFGISIDPYGNHSWTDLLVWGVETYDLNVDWWAQDVDRLNMGVAFSEEWYDSSIILIRKKQTVPQDKEIIYFNWVTPYESNVWYLTIFTILLSSFVYQLLEYMANEREDRTLWEWTTDNLFKSFLGFTQELQFNSRTFEKKLFLISMALFALILTATYTANLASLLVSKIILPPPIGSIQEAVNVRTPICTLKGTNSDNYIRENMPAVIRIEKNNLMEIYDGLQAEECDLVAEAMESWGKIKQIRKYNPTCNLEQVNAIVRSNKAGFATKADVGHLCTSLIRDVINVHMSEMILDGFLEDAWATEHKLSHDIDCNAYRPDLTDVDARRLLALKTTENSGTNHYNEVIEIRRLKGGGSKSGAAGGAVAANNEGGNNDRLTLQQMIGSFLFHWLLMALSLTIGVSKMLYKKHVKRNDSQKNTMVQNDPIKERYEEDSLTDHHDTRLVKLPEKDLHKQLQALLDSQDNFKNNHFAELCRDQGQLLQEQKTLNKQIGALVSLVRQLQQDV